MAWAASLLAGTGGQIAAILAGGLVLVGIGWGLIAIGRRLERAAARGSDLEIRAAAEKASAGGYAGEQARMEGLDPISGERPDGPDAGGVRPLDPGAGPS